MAEAKKVKARVLIDSVYGKCNEVVDVESAQLKDLTGVVDAEPAAVAYAEAQAGAK